MIQKVWAFLIGTVSTVIGTLRFLSVVSIPALDATIHIITGLVFIGGAIIGKGKFISYSNFFLGIFYIGFGIKDSNLPHIIAGLVSVAISLAFQPRAFRKNV
jgi:hypothetical protein